MAHFPDCRGVLDLHQSTPHLGVYIHGDDVVQIDQLGAASLAEAQQAVQLEEVGGGHQLENVRLADRELLAATLVQEVHYQLKQNGGNMDV